MNLQQTEGTVIENHNIDIEAAHFLLCCFNSLRPGDTFMQQQ